jgi:hypothetical protein
MTTSTRIYLKKYEDNVDLIGTDGYGNYLDGYDDVGFVDGYNIEYDDGKKQSFDLYHAWKLRRNLDELNCLFFENDPELYKEQFKVKVESKNRLKELCKLIDRSEEDGKYERVCSKDDIRLRKYPKDSFIKVK